MQNTSPIPQTPSPWYTDCVSLRACLSSALDYQLSEGRDHTECILIYGVCLMKGHQVPRNEWSHSKSFQVIPSCAPQHLEGTVSLWESFACNFKVSDSGPSSCHFFLVSHYDTSTSFLLVTAPNVTWLVQHTQRSPGELTSGKVVFSTLWI
jgi:hypothetical protein